MKTGTNRPTDLEVDAHIRAEVERIREEHPFRGDYRKQLRALVETMFLRFGERAGASRLVALLAEDGRSPSTSTAQDEINRFWERLRENAKVRIERPDLPDFLLDIFGKAASTVWENALAQAEAALATFRADAEAQVRDAQARAGEAQQRADEAEAAAAQASARERIADVSREEMAIRLASAESARNAAEASIAQLRTESAERERQRAEEAAGYQRTIEQLREATARFESEQRKLMVIADNYTTAAARDREAREKSEENNRALNITLQSQQGAINRLSTERGIFEGRAVAAENHAQRLQEDRDRAMAEATEATQRATRAEARADRFEGALQAIKAKNKSQHPQSEEPENAGE